MRTKTLLLLAVASLPACKWTEFDDLQGQTWVTSTEKPNVKSTDYGVAIQRGSLDSDTRLVVVGAGPTTYSELVYDARGDASLPTTTRDLGSLYSITNLDPQPILLADPSGDDVALVVSVGTSITVIVGAKGMLNAYQLALQPSTVDAATYMQPPPRTDPGHAGEMQPVQPLIASGDTVVGTFYMNAPSPQPRCKLVEALPGTASVQVRALGAVPSGTSDDVLAWGADGKLYRYAGSVFNGCVTPMQTQTPIGFVDTGFMPGRGSQILALDATHVLLQGHHDSDEASVLQVYNVGAAAPAAVGGAVSLPKLRSAAILNAGGTQYAVAAYPTNAVDGRIAGQVLLFKITAAGLDSTMPAETLNDAQPEDNEAFGRSVAVMPYFGKQLIAVAANNEIFMYFRTSVYGETRPEL